MIAHFVTYLIFMQLGTTEIGVRRARDVPNVLALEKHYVTLGLSHESVSCRNIYIIMHKNNIIVMNLTSLNVQLTVALVYLPSRIGPMSLSR